MSKIIKHREEDKIKQAAANEIIAIQLFKTNELIFCQYSWNIIITSFIHQFRCCKRQKALIQSALFCIKNQDDPI